MSTLADAHRAYDEYRRGQLIKEAAALGVELAGLDPEMYPGLHLSYRPPDPDWPDIHLSRYPYDWRLQEVDIPDVTYDRWWRFDIARIPFADVIRALGDWQGDPGSEPRGFTLSWDRREHDDFTR